VLKTRLTASLTVEIAPRYLTTIMTAAETFESVTNAARAIFSLLMKVLNQNNEDREVLGQEVPVAGLDSLIRRKIWAWERPRRRASKRKKDELDLLQIAETIQNYVRKFRSKLSNN
jgi:hypothetical protein